MQGFADRRRTAHPADLRWLLAFHRHGTMRSRIDAFIFLWNDIPKYRWAARLARGLPASAAVTQCPATEPCVPTLAA
jgi:hypothetical protein